MKIMEFTERELEQSALQYARDHRSASDVYLLPTPAERAVLILLRAMETINQAGLDGKKLSDIRLVERCEAHGINRVYEFHAKVTHRLRATP
jgi:hypothetical protein